MNNILTKLIKPVLNSFINGDTRLDFLSKVEGSKYSKFLGRKDSTIIH